MDLNSRLEDRARKIQRQQWDRTRASITLLPPAPNTWKQGSSTICLHRRRRRQSRKTNRFTSSNRTKS